MPTEEVDEIIEAMPAEEVDEIIEAMPAEEVDEIIEAPSADEEFPGAPDGIEARLREIIEYMGGAYAEGDVPEPVQRLFGYIEGNDLDGLRENLNPLWKDLFKENQSGGSYHANAVTRSFRALRELLGPPQS
jgi:hypothetical protein